MHFETKMNLCGCNSHWLATWTGCNPVFSLQPWTKERKISPVSQLSTAAVTTGHSFSHYSLLYLQWSPGINSPFVTKHLSPDVWYTHTAGWGWRVYAFVYVCIHACVCISDSRLSLKLKQKRAHPPSQLYLFMPSATQCPRACKHTNHPHCVTHTLIRSGKPPGGGQCPQVFDIRFK